MSALSTLARDARRAILRLQLVGAGRVGRNVEVRGRVELRGAKRVFIGDDVILDGRRAPVELNAAPGGTITLADGVRVTGGASLETASSITVGARTVIDGYAKLIDSPFHATTGDRHTKQTATPIAVGEDCTIGWRAVLLPGATLGRAVEVRAQAVVSRPIPDDKVAFGAPLRVAPKGRV